MTQTGFCTKSAISDMWIYGWYVDICARQLVHFTSLSENEFELVTLCGNFFYRFYRSPNLTIERKSSSKPPLGTSVTNIMKFQSIMHSCLILNA